MITNGNNPDDLMEMVINGHVVIHNTIDDIVIKTEPMSDDEFVKICNYMFDEGLIH